MVGFARKIEDCREAAFRLANRRLQPLGHLMAPSASIRDKYTYTKALDAEAMHGGPPFKPPPAALSARNKNELRRRDDGSCEHTVLGTLLGTLAAFFRSFVRKWKENDARRAVFSTVTVHGRDRATTARQDSVRGARWNESWTLSAGASARRSEMGFCEEAQVGARNSSHETGPD